MTVGRWLFSAAVVGAVVLITTTARAVKLDDFDAYSTGTIVATGNDATGGVWSTLGTNNAVIAGDAGNRVLSYGAGSNSHAWRVLPAASQIADTATATTMFVRVKANAVNPNNSIGLSATNPVTNADDFGVYNAQFRLISDVATSYRIDVRNGANFQSAMTGLNPGTWYNVWMVINQTTDTWDAYINSGTANATAANLVASNIAFRVATTNPLVSFLAYGGAGPTLGGSIDDIYLTPGVDLVNHASPATVAGDTSGNGIVEPTDLNPIRNNLFKNVTLRTQGDLNVDNIVNFADFREWKNAIGSGSGGSGTNHAATPSVPEPSSAILLLSAVAAAIVAAVRWR